MDLKMINDRNVVFVSVGLKGGGSERVMSVLANKFVEQGMKVSFLLLKSDVIEYELNPEIEITYCKFENGKRLYQHIKFIRNFIKKKPNCTVISFFTYQSFITILATRGLKCRVIVSERNDPRMTVSNILMSKIRNVLYSFSDKVVFQTPDAANLFPNYIVNNSTIISNPIKEFLPNPYKGIRFNEFVAFSRLEEQKNIRMMIDAYEIVADKHPDYELQIFGKGPMEKDLKKYVELRGMGEKIIFEGFSDNIHKRVLKSFAFLSSSNYEGISNSMIEAMAMGLPCVCTDCPIGGARMNIKNGENGILVPVNDSYAMADAMIKLIEDPDMYESISENSTKIKKTLSVDKIVKQWMDIL